MHDSVYDRIPLKAIQIIGLQLEMLLFRRCKLLKVRRMFFFFFLRSEDVRLAVQQVPELHSYSRGDLFSQLLHPPPYTAVQTAPVIVPLKIAAAYLWNHRKKKKKNLAAISLKLVQAEKNIQIALNHLCPRA